MKSFFNIIEKTLKVSPTIHNEGNVMLVHSIPILGLTTMYGALYCLNSQIITCIENKG